MIRAAILCTLLSQCAFDYDYRTKHGFYVRDHTGEMSKSDIEQATEFLILELGEGRKVLDNLLVIFTAEPVYLGGLPRNGLAFVNLHKVKVVKTSSCIAHTAFVHELTHIILAHLHDDQDDPHLRPEWHKTARAELIISRAVCGYRAVR